MITGELIGAERLVERVTALGPRTRASMEQSIVRLTLLLLRKVKAEKLSGQVLNVKTGRLRRSINQRVSGRGTSAVDGVVGTNVIYGRVFEIGGPVTIKAHQRMMTKAWGKPVKDPRPIAVRAHVVNYPEKSFLRTALRDLDPEIRQELTGIARQFSK